MTAVRRPGSLALRVDGQLQQLRPSKGALTRGSYRVRARIGDDDLLLTPSSPSAARLVRGSSRRVENELGSLERVHGCLMVATWASDVTVLGVTAKALVPEPVEAAVGYAMAAAFGTGARFFLGALIEGIGQADPF